MNTEILTLAGSVVVIALMLAVAALLGFRERARLDATTLAALLANYEPDARIEVAAIDEKGGAALAKLADGRLMAARVMADGASIRIVKPDETKLRIGKGRVIARFADIGFPGLDLRLSDAPPWLAALAHGDAA